MPRETHYHIRYYTSTYGIIIQFCRTRRWRARAGSMSESARGPDGTDGHGFGDGVRLGNDGGVALATGDQGGRDHYGRGSDRPYAG